MRRWDQAMSILGLVLGIYVVTLSLGMSLGSWNQPGPGFLPLGAGVALALFSVIYGASSWLDGRAEYRSRPLPWREVEHWHRVIVTFAALLVYGLALDVLGFLVGTFLLMLVLLRVLEPSKWTTTIMTAAVIVTVAYVVFGRWLMVPFPPGLLGL